MYKCIQSYFKIMRSKVLFVFLLFVSAQTLLICYPLLIQAYLDGLLINITPLLFISILLCIVFATKDILLNTIVNKISCSFLVDSVAKLFHAPLSVLNSIDKTYTASIINNFSFLLPCYYLYDVTEVILHCISFISVLLIVGLNLPEMIPLLIILVISEYLIGLFFSKKQSSASKLFTNDSSVRMSDIHRFFESWKVKKSLAAELNLKEFLWHESISCQESFTKKNRMSSLFSSQLEFWSQISLLIILSIVANKVYEGKISIGSYEVMYSYLFLLLNDINVIFNFKQKLAFIRSQFDLYNKVMIQKEIEGNEIVFSVDSIDLRNISFSYPGKEILCNFYLSLHVNRIYYIKGKNGCGKSTLMNLIALLIHADSGEIFVNNIPSTKINKELFRRKLLSILDQKTILFPLSLRENISLSETTDNTLVNLLIKSWNLQKVDKENDLSEITLSGGEEKRIGLARMEYDILVNKKQILILDEPTNHLDDRAMELVNNFIITYRKDHLIFIVSHNENLINIADEIISL